jgi:predicted Zn-dependent protease
MSANLSEPQRNRVAAAPRGLRQLGQIGLHRVLPTLVLLALLGLAWTPLAREYRQRAAHTALAKAERGDVAQAERAAALLQRAVEERPHDATLRQRLAQAYTLAGDHASALVELERAWQLRPESTLGQRELALAYERAGLTDKADTLWRSLGLHAPQMRVLADRYAELGDTDAAAAWRTRAERMD